MRDSLPVRGANKGKAVTIVLGLISKHGGVVMSDGRRHAAWQPGETPHVESDRTKKAFRCGSAPFIFGLAGQLAPSGAELSDVIARALDTARVVEVSRAFAIVDETI